MRQSGERLEIEIRKMPGVVMKITVGQSVPLARAPRHFVSRITIF